MPADYSLKITSEPDIEPVTVEEVKEQLRIDSDDEDALLARLISVARRHGETVLRRSFISTTWRMKLDYFPRGITLTRAPVISVESITYLDVAGDSQTLSSGVYSLNADDEPARIVLAYGQSWPSVRDILRAVTITFVAGYGTTAADVPETIRHWILLAVGQLYENREMTPQSLDVSMLSPEAWSSYP